MEKKLRAVAKLCLILFLFFSAANTSAQTTMFQFNFENTTNPSTDNVTGTPSFDSDGLTGTGYSTATPCQAARMYTGANWDGGDYYRFTVNTSGFGGMAFSFCTRTNNADIGTFLVRVSADGNNWTTVLNNFTPTTNNNTLTTANFPAAVNNAAQVYIDILKVSNGANNARTLLIDSATLTGYPSPAVTGFSPATVCVGSSIAITGTNMSGATSVKVNGTEVTSFTVNSATSISAVVAPGTTTGTISVTNTYGTGTSASSLTVNALPSSVTATPSATTICAGGSINLTSSATANGPASVTLLSENFNAATNDWTKINNTTGGNTTQNNSAAWTLRPEGYQYATSSTVTFSSNDNSQFYLSNSDSPGNNTTTSTILQSPAFSTVGMTASSFTFYQYYRPYTDSNTPESANVEISLNGTSWTSLASYTTAQGTSGNFLLTTFSLASYLNQATVYVRFRYAATYDYYWAVDNVLITGTPGVTYAWTSTPAGFTSSLQNPTNVTPAANTTYTVTVTNGNGCSTSASTALVTVNPVSVGGTVGNSQTICSGTQPATLNLTGNTGSVVKWQRSSDAAFTTPTDITNTTTSLTGAAIGNLTATTYFRAVVQSGVCAVANAAYATITVNPVSVGGTVGNSQTICSGTQPATLNLTGNTGSVVKWQRSSDAAFTTPTDITNTTTSLTGAAIGNLTATTYFRAVVQSGVCAVANAAYATITVNPVSVGGTVGNSQTICSGTQPATLNLTGNTGSVVKWQRSSDAAFTTPTDITNTTTSLTGAAIGNLTATTYFRAVVQNGVCAVANSAYATINIDAVSVGGTVGNSQTICSGTQPATLNLTGNTGSVVKWQRSSDAAFTTPTDITNTTTSLTGAAIGNLTATTYFRAVVQSGVCAVANSAYATINIDAVSVGGTVGNSQTICSGTQPATLNLTGNTGSVVKWQRSSDAAFTTPTDITNTTTSLTGAAIGNLTATTYFRAVVQSGVCAVANSAYATISVDAVSVGGTVSGATTVCTASNSGSLTLSGYAGNIVKWQSSDVSDFSASVLDIPNTTATLGYSNLTSTTYYRAVVGNGICSVAFSTIAEITVSPAATGGTVSGATAACYGNNSGNLTLSGHAGTITGWESSANNFATAGTPIANTTASLTYNNLTATTSYRAIISGGACGSVYSSVATITVDVNTIWTGANGTAWSDAGNWSCGAVPTNMVHVTIPVTANQPLISANAFANTLTMETGTTLTVQTGNDFAVTDVITVQGTAVFTVENNANLIQVNDVNNTGDVTVKRTSSPLKRLDYTLWSSPVSGQNILAFSPLTQTSRFYTYNTFTNLYNAVTVPATTNFEETQGYLIRMPNNHPTTATVWNGTFKGIPHNGNASFTMVNNGNGQRFNLIGNPYPSTLDATTFVNNNSSSITGTLYFWRKTNNAASPSYCSWTAGGGFVDNGEAETNDPNGVIQTGQGFFVEALGFATTVNFNNGQRLGDNAGQFFRSAEIERNRIWLNVTNTAGAYCQTLVGYITDATLGNDQHIDGKYINDSATEFYSLIADEKYVIQGRPLPFNAADVVPMGFKATTAGEYTINIDHMDGLFSEGQDVFVKDNLTGNIHDLNASAYTFATEAGTFNSRFEIVYQNALGTTNPDLENQVIIYKQQDNIVINSGSAVMATVRIFDIRGRLLTEKKDINASEVRMNAGEANQVLIVQITSDDNRVVTRKTVN